MKNTDKFLTKSPPIDPIEALAQAVAPHVARILGALVAVPPRPYSQKDGERPAGAGRVLYLREHRALVRAGDPGAWSEGRARLMTSDAWSRAMAKHRPPPPPASETRPVDLDSQALADLGLARRSAS